MKDNCFFSIIIPVFNAERYINKCIDSILKQTFEDFEIIVIDDGSTDRTDEIVRALSRKDRRVKYYRQKNSGPLSARITGIEKSVGNYFMFCDADDYYGTRNALKILYDIAANNEFDILQFAFWKKFGFLKAKIVHFKESTKDRDAFLNNDYPKLLCGFWDDSNLTVHVWNKMYKRKMADNIDPKIKDERVFMEEDIILNLHLCEKCHKLYCLPKTLYCYRQFSGGTNRWSTKTMYDLNTVKQYQLKFIEKESIDNIDNKDKIINVLFSEVAAYFFLHIQQGLDVLTREEMVTYIKEILELPAFVQAREYYKSNNEQWEAVRLLREADPEKYISAACESKKNIPLSKKLKNTIRKII